MSAAVRLARHLEYLDAAEMAALSDRAGVPRKIGARARAGRKIGAAGYMLLCNGCPREGRPAQGRDDRVVVVRIWPLPHPCTQTARPSRRCRPHRTISGDLVAGRAVPAGSGRKLPPHLRLHRDSGRELPVFHRNTYCNTLKAKEPTHAVLSPSKRHLDHT